MRKKIIAGNWKMYKTVSEAVDLVKKIIPLVKDSEAEVVVCPNYVCLSEVAKLLPGTNVALGAQDLYWEKEGAFTGKVSGPMLKSVGADFVIIGHSEQRSYFHETNETVNKKVKAALEHGLRPIVCVGEVLAERESGKTEQVVRNHVEGAFAGISEQDLRKCVIAYEPVWAIGTGKTASPEQAQEVHAFIRGLLSRMYNKTVAQEIQIQYGGSMKPENAKDLLSQPDIDGGLIGGAALKADSFAGIVNFKG